MHRVLVTASLAAAMLLVAAPLSAQTDYFNLDHGRPTRVTDAYPVEFGALEWHAAPLRLERSVGGVYHWGLEPQLAWGISPLTQLEFGLPLSLTDQAGGPTVRGVAGFDVALTRTLIVERTDTPALAVGVSALLPWGSLAPSSPYLSVRALATRTLPGVGRLHLNIESTTGPALSGAAAGGVEQSRWMVGAAFDRAVATKSLLMIGELYAQRSLDATRRADWTASVGARWQAAPQWALDAGLGRRFIGSEHAWTFTAGTSYSFGLRPLVRLAPRPATFSVVAEQFYLPAAHNWTFRDRYPGADRLFNAFDYGHAILSEVLSTTPTASAVPRLEEQEYAYLTRTLLVSPPRLPIAEVVVMPSYGRLAPEAKLMFEWAHILHRQVYDVLADERLTPADRDAAIAELLHFYKSRPDLAFSSQPKSMALMQEQPYSLAFRQAYPKFNGLIWSYHWMQMALYEPLLVATTSEARQAGVAAAVARFRQMHDSAPNGFPVMMPMTAAVSPAFSARYPELAIIFDNLHSMHDVVSDILANPSVPDGSKRGEILKAGAAYRDDTTETMTVEGWRKMSVGMGIENQGGPAIGILGAVLAPTMPRGMVMKFDRDGNPVGDHMHHD